MSAPEPRANPLLLGQGAAEATLLEAMRAGRLHHAWLLTGPQGVGKATLAFRFARRLLAGRGEADLLALDPRHPTFRRVAAWAHADLLTVERAWDEKRKRLRGEIVVADVLRIADFLHLTPAEGGWRVVVLDGAEDLNRSAANALLKVLEEPPPRAVLLLVCSAAGRLLPTIRSRCRRLGLGRLPEAEVEALLARYLPETLPAEQARLAGLAEGSIGRALALAEGGGLGAAELVGKVWGARPAPDGMLAHEVADALGRDEDAFATFFDLLRASLAAAVRAAARGQADAGQQAVLGTRPLAAWIDVWHALTDLQGETEAFHLDRRQAIVAGFDLLARRGVP